MPEKDDAEMERRVEWGVYKAKIDEMDKHVMALKCTVDKLRDTFDPIYAAKLVERIVFSFVGLALLAVVGALIALVVKK